MEWMPSASVIEWVPRVTDAAKQHLASAFTEVQYPFCYDAERIVVDGHDAVIGTNEDLELQYDIEQIARSSIVIKCDEGGAEIETRILNALVGCYNHKVMCETHRSQIKNAAQ